VGLAVDPEADLAEEPCQEVHREVAGDPLVLHTETWLDPQPGSLEGPSEAVACLAGLLEAGETGVGAERSFPAAKASRQSAAPKS